MDDAFTRTDRLRAARACLVIADAAAELAAAFVGDDTVEELIEQDTPQEDRRGETHGDGADPDAFECPDGLTLAECRRVHDHAPPSAQ